MRDALAKVKADLGPDAIILSTQRLDDGEHGHGASIVEITATVEVATQRPAAGLQFFQRTSRGRAPMPLDYQPPSNAPTAADLQEHLAVEEHVEASQAEPSQPPQENQALESMLRPLLDEVRDLRDIVSNAGLLHRLGNKHAARIRPGAAPELFEEKPQAAPEPPAPVIINASSHNARTEPLPGLGGARKERRRRVIDTPAQHHNFDDAPLALAQADEPEPLPIAPSNPNKELPWLPIDNMFTRQSAQATHERPSLALPLSETTSTFEDIEEDKALEALRRSLMSNDQARSLVRDPIEQLEGWLQRSDVAPDRRANLVQGVKHRLGMRRAASREDVERAFIEELLERVQIRPARELDRRRIVAFVGPTGVGKTTTLAKIAAEQKIDKHRTVGLLTIDTYRIGAVEQLRRYANLLEIPLEVAVDRISLKRSLRRLDHCDVILIDTIGRSPRDEEPVRQLGALFEGIHGLSFELCLSATTSIRDMSAILRNYSQLAPESVLFTKLDETFAIGPLLSSHLDSGVPLSHFTTGQSVPEDIEHASVERLLGMILPLND